MHSISLRLVYDGSGPIKWGRRPGTFGMQDKDGRIHTGTAGPQSTVSFDLTLHVKSGKAGEPVLLGPCAHGTPASRFLYLAWCEPDGRLAQRLKIPLGGIAWDDIRAAIDRHQPLVAVLVDHQPRVTSTGENIGGSRPVAWTPA